MDAKPKINHFTDLEIWRKSHRLFLDVFADVEKFPRMRATDILADQALRSVGSISANIAEGFNRSTRKFLNPLDIAVGETNEAENWLYKIRDTVLLDPATASQRIEQCKQIGRMINGLIGRLESKSR